eukprot:g70613.t1
MYLKTRGLRALLSTPVGVRRLAVVVKNNLFNQEGRAGSMQQLEGLNSSNPYRLTWYICGPTVYDHSHIGHARTYMCFDIIARMLTDLFGFELTLVMGMTDVDDKIINRARESGEHPTSLARRFEQSFKEDMAALHIRPPATYLRVSDHVPQIIVYIQKIIDRGHAYIGDGSVYFDLTSFKQHGGVYPKLPGFTVGQSENRAPADEPDLRGRKRLEDFALWKRCEADSHGWQSPWGYGRPGWHIECSTFSSLAFGERLDLHSGGVDLCFPHHTNEIAQCEAVNNGPWVKYFIHSGHLHIRGRKMSKSLKNFITIQEFLREYTPAQWRMFCLQHKYHANVDFSPDRMLEASRALTRFVEFFSMAHQHASAEASESLWREAEKGLHQKMLDTQTQVAKALSCDFDTPTALNLLFSLVTDTNKYLAQGGSATSSCKEMLRLVSSYVKRILSIFGFQASDLDGHFRAATGVLEQHMSDHAVEEVEAFRRSVRNLAITALKGRKRSKRNSTQDDEIDPASLLHLCDELRDKALPRLGIATKDGAVDGAKLWRRLSPHEQPT